MGIEVAFESKGLRKRSKQGIGSVVIFNRLRRGHLPAEKGCQKKELCRVSGARWSGSDRVSREVSGSAAYLRASREGEMRLRVSIIGERHSADVRWGTV